MHSNSAAFLLRRASRASQGAHRETPCCCGQHDVQQCSRSGPGPAPRAASGNRAWTRAPPARYGAGAERPGFVHTPRDRDARHRSPVHTGRHAGVARGHRAGRVPDRARHRAADRRRHRGLVERDDHLRPAHIGAGRPGGHRSGSARQVPGHRHRPRRGRDRSTEDLHLLIHLARAGWLRWSDALSTTPPKMGGPIAMRVRLGNGRLRHHRGRHQEVRGRGHGPRSASRPGGGPARPDALALDRDGWPACSAGRPAGSRP